MNVLPSRNDGFAILTVEIGALDRAIVLGRNAHVGPVNVSGLNIDNDAVRNSASVDNDFSVRAVGVSRMNPAAACFEKKQAPVVAAADLRFGLEISVVIFIRWFPIVSQAFEGRHFGKF